MIRVRILDGIFILVRMGRLSEGIWVDEMDGMNGMMMMEWKSVSCVYRLLRVIMIRRK